MKHKASQPDLPQTPRFTRDQPVWWQRRQDEEPLPAIFAYYPQGERLAVIDVVVNGRERRKFAKLESLTPREEQS